MRAGKSVAERWFNRGAPGPVHAHPEPGMRAVQLRYGNFVSPEEMDIDREPGTPAGGQLGPNGEEEMAEFTLRYIETHKDKRGAAGGEWMFEAEDAAAAPVDRQPPSRYRLGRALGQLRHALPIRRRSGDPRDQGLMIAARVPGAATSGVGCEPA